jgi:hypothetical protein
MQSVLVFIKDPKRHWATEQVPALQQVAAQNQRSSFGQSSIATAAKVFVSPSQQAMAHEIHSSVQSASRSQQQQPQKQQSQQPCNRFASESFARDTIGQYGRHRAGNGATRKRRPLAGDCQAIQINQGVKSCLKTSSTRTLLISKFCNTRRKSETPGL